MSVTPDTIAVALGRPTLEMGSPQWQQWVMWINDAMMLIRSELGDPAFLDPIPFDYVVREAVKAMVLRPDDATQVDIAIDDGRVSKRYQSSKGRVTILDEWWSLLAPERSTGSAFSIRPYHKPDLAGLQWSSEW